MGSTENYQTPIKRPLTPWLDVCKTQSVRINGYKIEPSADLSKAFLFGANLTNADLRNTKLSGAFLYGANLESADLEGADLSGATLRGANLSGANLESADLRGATCPNGIVHGQPGADC